MTRYARRWRAWILGAALGLSPAVVAAGVFPTQYDAVIREAWEMYHPGSDWLLWKAQLYCESRLDPNARSPVGAEGVAQFMPATWKEVTKAMGLGAVDRRMAEPSIRAGAFYMRRLVYIWRAPRSDLSRIKLAEASYNAGAMHLIRSQAACGGKKEYDEIIPCLPMITGRHSTETIQYVIRIHRTRKLMMR